MKEQAESILSALGIPASNAINMFYKQIILNRGLPFEVKIHTVKPVNVIDLTEAELNAELEKGYVDMAAGRTSSSHRTRGMDRSFTATSRYREQKMQSIRKFQISRFP